MTDLRAESSALFRFRLRLAPGIYWPCRLAVTESAPPSRIRFAIESMFHAEETCSFSDENGKTRITFETKVHTPGGILGPGFRRNLRLPDPAPAATTRARPNEKATGGILMKAVEIQKWGLENLNVAERANPEPGPGEVLIRVRACSLNYRDLLMAKGMYNPKQKLPLVPCSDGTGEVLAVGAGVTRAKVGDRVAATFFQGLISRPLAYDEEPLRKTLGGPLDGMLAERVVLSQEGIVQVPEHLSWAEAATLPCAGLTAFSALHTVGHLQSSDTVVIQGTGGVSISRCNLPPTWGRAPLCCRPRTTSSSDANRSERLISSTTKKSPSGPKKSKPSPVSAPIKSLKSAEPARWPVDPRSAPRRHHQHHRSALGRQRRN